MKVSTLTPAHKRTKRERNFSHSLPTNNTQKPKQKNKKIILHRKNKWKKQGQRNFLLFLHFFSFFFAVKFSLMMVEFYIHFLCFQVFIAFFSLFVFTFLTLLFCVVIFFKCCSIQINNNKIYRYIDICNFFYCYNTRRTCIERERKKWQ